MRALVQYQQHSLRDADFSSQFLGLLQREGHARAPEDGAAAAGDGARAPEDGAAAAPDAAGAPSAYGRGAPGAAPGGGGGGSGWSPPDMGDVGSAFHGLNLRSAPSSVTIAEHREAAGLPAATDLGALLAAAAPGALPNGGGASGPAAPPPAYALGAGEAGGAGAGFGGGPGAAGLPLDDFALDMLSSASGDMPMADDSSFWEQLMQQPSAGGGAGPAFAPAAAAEAPPAGGLGVPASGPGH